MPKLIKILHIDPEFQTTYFIVRPRSFIRTSIPLRDAIELLKTEDFDLIISEPHHRAILKEDPEGPAEINLLNDNPILEANHGGIGKIRSNRYS
jgi:hypothetical protein